MTTKITSSGIIRNAEKPRVGCTNNASPEFLDEIIQSGIDLTWEEYDAEIQAKIESGELTVDQAQEEIEYAEFDSHNYIYGAWKKDDKGLYSIDPDSKEFDFAVSYNTNSSFGSLVTVEWSKHTKPCKHTSPCLVMADGSGPCGDLDSDGDSVIAYTLPEDCFYKE